MRFSKPMLRLIVSHVQPGAKIAVENLNAALFERVWGEFYGILLILNKNRIP